MIRLIELVSGQPTSPEFNVGQEVEYCCPVTKERMLVRITGRTWMNKSWFYTWGFGSIWHNESNLSSMRIK